MIKPSKILTDPERILFADRSDDREARRIIRSAAEAQAQAASAQRAAAAAPQLGAAIADVLELGARAGGYINEEMGQGAGGFGMLGSTLAAEAERIQADAGEHAEAAKMLRRAAEALQVRAKSRV